MAEALLYFIAKCNEVNFMQKRRAELLSKCWRLSNIHRVIEEMKLVKWCRTLIK